MPAVGGFFGLGIGAGPLPIIGNLILHLVYGATLGTLYGPAGRVVVGDEAPTELEGQVTSQQVVLGDNLLAALVVAAMTGAALGGLVGSFIGLTYAGEETKSARSG